MNRPTIVTLLAGAALATTACSDRPSPMAPDAPLAAAASASGAVQADADASDDLDDLLGRIIPALGDHRAVDRLRNAIRQLRNESAPHAAADSTPAARRSLDLASEALDELEREGDPAILADLGVVRLVIEARQ